MKYNEINNSHKPVLSNTALIKYDEIVVTRVKIEIKFGFGRLGSHVYHIYLQGFYNTRSCFV